MSESDSENPISILSYALQNQSVNKAAETTEDTQSKPNEIIASKSILKKTVELPLESESVKLNKSAKPVQQPALPLPQRLCRTVAKQVAVSTQPTIQRCSSRDRLPRKTVAFGLTTNLDDTVERTQQRLSTLRPPSIAGVPVMKNFEEVQKTVKSLEDEITALKADNVAVKKKNEELREELSKMRSIMTDISSRVMRLEDGSNTKVVQQPLPAAVTDGTSEAGDSQKQKPPRPMPVAAQQQNKSPPPRPSAQRLPLNEPSRSSLVTAPPEPTLRSRRNEQRRLPAQRDPGPDVGRVMTMLGNRIRENPEVIYDVCRFLEENRTQVPKRKEDSCRVGLTDNHPPNNHNNSPYSARYTQKMTFEHVYSIQGDVPTKNFAPSYRQRPYNPPSTYIPISSYPTVDQRRPPITTGDEEFFENENDLADAGRQNIGYEKSEDQFFHDTTYGNGGVLDQTARTDNTLTHRPPVNENIRERYRHRK